MSRDNAVRTVTRGVEFLARAAEAHVDADRCLSAALALGFALAALGRAEWSTAENLGLDAIAVLVGSAPPPLGQWPSSVEKWRSTP